MLLADGMGYNSMVILNSISSTWITFLMSAIAASAALKQKKKNEYSKIALQST